MRRPLVVGNWKMHGDGAWLDEIGAIGACAAETPGVEVALCLPATLIERAAQLYPALRIGAQDCHQATEGAYTGSISAGMIREAGAALVILGHSERRREGDTDAIVAAKVAAALAVGLGVVLCVGESAAERDAGQAVEAVSAQLARSLPEGDLSGVVVAYEPVWAIGKGVLPEPSDVQHVASALRRLLGKRAVANMILYGGSVTADIAGAMMREGGIDGLLVGQASLRADRFAPVVRMVEAGLRPPLSREHGRG